MTYQGQSKWDSNRNGGPPGGGPGGPPGGGPDGPPGGKGKGPGGFGPGGKGGFGLGNMLAGTILKRAEWERYLAAGGDPNSTDVSDWELAYYLPFH